uniref:Sphingomyelin synthase-like domain-containing protein n=1 Tax=Odontella aurita TaxID=265563 RepID=A0A7S4I8H4_9STRA|mmetsp:Transcript_2119/g.5603  ORF Transcript_2119/g.5603 Transcript_2119/m.5603 type:complete len:527 (+) Transcript_2119:323-1903(+)
MRERRSGTPQDRGSATVRTSRDESPAIDPESHTCNKSSKTHRLGSSATSSPSVIRVLLENSVVRAAVSFFVLLLVLASIIFLTGRTKVLSSPKLGHGPGYYATVLFASIPVLVALSVASQRKYESNERVVAAAFAISIAGNQLPRVVAKFGAAALAAGFGLATRPAVHSSKSRDYGAGKKRSEISTEEEEPGGRGNVQEYRGPLGLTLKPLAFLSTFFLVAVLLTENFLVWVVSATYKPGQDSPYPEALQDNGQIVVTYLMDVLGLTRRDAQDLRDAFNVQWALVSSAVAGALLGCELGLGRAKSRSMWAVGMRAVLALACARAVRGISFILTVLPSQVQGCYRHKYPYPPPTEWIDWILVGIKPAARGGCNDLIVSGHATVTSILACVATSVGDNTLFSIAVWSLLTLDYLVEVLQGFHYSVDMWLGAIITSLIFRSLALVEDIHDPEPKPNFAPLSSIKVTDVFAYGAPAFLGFVVLTVTNEATANVWIVLYMVAAVVTQLKGMAHVSRNVLICTMYIALGIYL